MQEKYELMTNEELLNEFLAYTMSRSTQADMLRVVVRRFAELILSQKNSEYKCPGCGRHEMHKMCPAYGTSKYMSGELFTEKDEFEYKNEQNAV